MDKPATISYNYRQHEPSRRPRENAFIQQRLATHHPVLNAGCVFPLFFILSAIFIPLGVGIYFYADNIFERTIEYSYCKSTDPDHGNLTCEQVLGGMGADSLEAHNERQSALVNYSYHHWHPGAKEDVDVTDSEKSSSTICNCRIDFELQEPIKGTVFIYYALTNFYQNHLKYYKSRDENQFKGGSVKFDKDNKEVPVDPSDSCTPEAYRIDNINRPILPCGLQAHSMFFDVIKLSHWYNDTDHVVALNKTDIAWGSDKRKFNNPKKMKNPKDTFWSYFGKPPAWKKHIWELDTNKSNNGFENEDFIIWMKTAAFPNFRKLHRIVNGRRPNYEDGLPAGKYSLLIEYNMLISTFDGTKSIIFTNSREVAAKNYFLAYACFITGILLFILFIAFFVIHLLTKNRNIGMKTN